MSQLREDLLRAGVPERVEDDLALDVERVERNIEMSQPTRLKVTVEIDRVVFETLLGPPRRVEVETARLWDPSRGGPLTSADIRALHAPLRRRSGASVSDEEVEEARSLGESVGIGLEPLATLFLLESVSGFGPQKFRELHAASIDPVDVARDPELLPTRGKRGQQFRIAIGALGDEHRGLAQRRAARQILKAAEHDALIVTYGHPLYPVNALLSNNPVPVMYVRGNAHVLAEARAVACVGSRRIRPPYAELHARFAEVAAFEGITVISGFALGADTIGHEAAVRARGRTVAVMPGGLDRLFPPENRRLWQELLSYPNAALVTEFPFGTSASSLTLRKRNKLIVALSRGVMVSQSSATGGAMNAYRFALEQNKQVRTFASDGQPDASGNALIEAAAEQPELGDPPHHGFPSRPDLESWKLWLRQLSFST